MLLRKKLLVALIASAFAFTAFAQAPKSDTAPKAPAGTEAKKDSTKPAKKGPAANTGILLTCHFGIGYYCRLQLGGGKNA